MRGLSYNTKRGLGNDGVADLSRAAGLGWPTRFPSDHYLIVPEFELGRR